MDWQWKKEFDSYSRILLFPEEALELANGARLPADYLTLYS